ncbi:MAG: hypothetical protein JST53_17615 [Actinobacteria bacterium]|nr:hypothetical protein [Actinomycetota bacterium]
MRERMEQRSRFGWLLWFVWLLAIVVASAKGEFALVGIIAFPFALALYFLDKRDKVRLVARGESVHHSAGR